MVTVTIENGEFSVHGSFDFGYMGIYHDDEILILHTPAEVREWETANAALEQRLPAERMILLTATLPFTTGTTSEKR